VKRIFYLYRDMTQMLGKYRAYIKPELFCDALHFASRGLFDEYYGNTKDYRPGHPLPRVAYQVTTAVTDALHPFLREVFFGRDYTKLAQKKVVVGPGTGTAEYRSLDASGRFSLPDDWVHPTAWSTLEALEDVQVLDDNEVITTLNSLVAPPDLEHPVLEVVPKGLQVHPQECSELHAKYLAFPRRPVYAVTYPAGQEPQYDDTKSVDVEWPASRDNQLLTRLLQYPALGLRDTVVQQVAQSLTAQGA